MTTTTTSTTTATTSATTAPATDKPASAPGGEAAVVAGRGALFIGFAKVYFMLSGFLQQVLLTRLVGLRDYGAFGVVNNVISIVNNTVVQGTIQSISKFTAEDDHRAGAVQRAGLRMQVGVGAALGLGFFLGAPWLAAFEKQPAYAGYFRIAAAIPFLYALYAVFVGSANGLRRFRAQAGFDVGFSTAKTVLLLGGAILWKVTGAFFGFAAAAVFILIVAARVMRLPPATDTPAFPSARLGRYMGAVVAYSFLLNVALNYDQPLLHHFAGVVDAQAAGVVAAHYQALRTLALLPYQALVVVTFVMFPLVSRATFAEDQAVTRAYVTQTLRYALILAAGMGLTLAARPGALLGILYKPEYGDGALALPTLVAGECCLALLSVSCAILNAAGRTRATLVLMALTVVVGGGAAATMVPAALPGRPMLLAAALATTLGNAVGLAVAIAVVRRRLGGSPPLATVARVALAIGVVVLVGRFVPPGGKLLGLVVTLVLAALYVAVLVASGEFGPADRAKVARILRRR
ncbi:MAG TPA: oligosaccharide flippase family protein [Polyangia bacterium]|nr:oligosaccharide flippase family protein [Polyangia bacterium]